MEQHLGRELLPEETVDHIDDDFTNDDLSNLQLLTLVENIKKQHERSPRKIYEFICPCCEKPSQKYLNEVTSNWKKGKSGPYCRKSCAGQSTYHNPWSKS